MGRETCIMSKGQFKVLCVDDCPVQLRLLGEVMRKHGYDADFAVDGVMALELVIGCKCSPYAVIVTDHDMPRVNGMLLAEIISKSSYPAEVIIHSSLVDKTMRQALLPNAISVLPKGAYDKMLDRLGWLREIWNR